jgi:alkylhydroperoxidase family enzyme
MAFIEYIPQEDIPATDRIADTDHILRIHGIHSKTGPLHYKLFTELMYAKGPLTRAQRELIAVTVSAINGCHY